MTNPLVDRTEGIVLLMFQNITIIGGLFYMMSEGDVKVNTRPEAPPVEVSTNKTSTASTTTKRQEAPSINKKRNWFLKNMNN